ncbi:ABC transporter ATP-binding protein [Cobetia marina]|uniref:ABC transporter ATP-binding protein n=1 Tax=Cobetia marina TaxID=28258 RepID=UPI001748E16C
MSAEHHPSCGDAVDATLKASELSLGYGSGQRHVAVIDALTLALPDGKVTAIVGPNGCGKSTLLAGLARLQAPHAGAVLLEGQDIRRLGRRDVAQRIALLPQETHSPEGVTVHELVRFGRQPHQGAFRQWSQEDQEVVSAAIAAADIESLADRELASMSGGQRQRAWIAMALAQQTPLLLLDEPTSALDLGHQIEVFELIQRLAHEEGKTIVMVVHDLASACRYADHLVAMHAGSVVAEGPPSEVVTPALVRKLYGVECRLIPDPETGTPLLIGVRRTDERLSGSAT